MPRLTRYVTFVAVCACIVLAGVSPALADTVPDLANVLVPGMPRSTTGPVPPPNVRPPAGGVRTLAAGEHMVAGVPAYLWHDGCGPTATGMIVGYYDGHGFPDLVPGDASSQTLAVNQMIASHGTSSAPRHYEDYAMPIDDSGPLQPDRSSTGGPTHGDDSIADFMHTSRSAESLKYGWSWSSYVGPAVTGYVQTQGYGVQAASYAYADSTWQTVKDEIDASRPLCFLVDSNGDGTTDHFVTVIGYRETNGYPEYAMWDTWYTSVRWAPFRATSASYQWGVWGATTYHFSPGAQPGEPAFQPDGGTFAGATDVTASCPTIGTVLRYTTDGSDPTSVSPIFGSSLRLTTTTTLKAKAFKEGHWASATHSAVFTITPARVAERIAGATRYDTAVEASRSKFPDGSVADIVVACGDNFPDALSAAGLAGVCGSPVLLAPSTTSGAGNAAALATLETEIGRLKSGSATPTVWLVGGTGAISESVRTSIASACGVATGRIAGQTRYGTAEAVAGVVAKRLGGSFSHVAFVVDGGTFQDALTAGPVAYARKWPVIATEAGRLTAESRRAISDNGVTKVYVVGSTTTVSAATLKALQGIAAVSAVRVAGASNAYQRSADFATWARANVPGSLGAHVGLVSGVAFPDGLGAAAALGSDNGTVLLTDPAGLSNLAFVHLTSNKGPLKMVSLFGGTGALGPGVWNTVVAAIK